MRATFRILGILLLLFAPSGSTAGQAMKQLTADATIQDLLSHPAFTGFGRLLLPWDDRTYDNSLRLRNIGSLLPYHSHVDPATIVTGLNHMIDDVSQGRRVFYDFYTTEQKNEEQTRSNTGLFFFRGKPGAPFAMAAIGSHGVARYVGDDVPKPSAVVMAYTGHSEYAANEPPTFAVVGERDSIAPPSVMEKRVEASRKARTEVEFHRYAEAGHGVGAGIGTRAEGWLGRAVRFWQKAIDRSVS